MKLMFEDKIEAAKKDGEEWDHYISYPELYQ